MPAVYDSASLLAVPVGGTIPVPSTGVPAGFLVCDGSAISKAVYAALFAAIGVAHGEPTLGGTTFNIPDYRGRFLRGYDGGAGRDPDRAARTGMNANGLAGDNIGSVQADAIQNITGSFGRAATMGTVTGPFFMSNAGAVWNDGGAVSQKTVNFDASLVARTSSETRSLNANTNFMIRYR